MTTHLNDELRRVSDSGAPRGSAVVLAAARAEVAAGHRPAPDRRRPALILALGLFVAVLVIAGVVLAAQGGEDGQAPVSPSTTLDGVSSNPSFDGVLVWVSPDNGGILLRDPDGTVRPADIPDGRAQCSGCRFAVAGDRAAYRAVGSQIWMVTSSG